MYNITIIQVMSMYACTRVGAYKLSYLYPIMPYSKYHDYE